MPSLTLQPGMPLDLSAVLARAKGTLSTNYGSTPQTGGIMGGGNNSALIQNAITQAQAAQKKANLANEQRYQQGLTGLQNAQQQSSGFISQALSGLDSAGTAAHTRIAANTANSIGGVDTSAAARGIANFTVTDALKRGVNSDAERANQAVDENVAGQKSAINLQQANNANSTAGTIAQFIANRNDVGPDLSGYASLIQGAAAGAPAGMRSGSVVRNSVPSSAFQLPSSSGGSSAPSGPGGYFTMGGTPTTSASGGVQAPQMQNVSGTPTTNLQWDGNSLVQQAIAAQPAKAADPLAGVQAIGPGMMSAAMDKGFVPPSWTETSGLSPEAVQALIQTRYRQWAAANPGKV